MIGRSNQRVAGTEEPRDRTEALRRLVEIAGPIPDLIRALERLPFPSDVALVELTRSDLVQALQSFKNGALSESDVRSWAQALEVREDLGYADDELAQLLFEIATPEINRPVTRTLADEWLAALSRQH